MRVEWLIVLVVILFLMTNVFSFFERMDYDDSIKAKDVWSIDACIFETPSNDNGVVNINVKDFFYDTQCLLFNSWNRIKELNNKLLVQQNKINELENRIIELENTINFKTIGVESTIVKEPKFWWEFWR